jgi:hypothetical protein
MRYSKAMKGMVWKIVILNDGSWLAVSGGKLLTL